MKNLKNHWMYHFKLSFIIIILLSIQLSNSTQQQWSKSFQPLRFGSNKPHLLFQLGSRKQLSFNMAYGYWLSKPQQPFTKDQYPSSLFSQIRYKYQNTQQGLYINMLNHNGQSLIHEQIKDFRYKVQSQIKYLYGLGDKDKQDQFQLQIKQKHFNNQEYGNNNNNNKIFNRSQQVYKKNQEQKEFINGEMNWFVHLSIQNTDLRLINHKDYLSPLVFKVSKENSKQVKVIVRELKPQADGKFEFQTQNIITFKSSNMQSINRFGFTVNISESSQAFSYLEEFQHLIELQRYSGRNIPRKNDSKIVDWQNHQIQEINKDKFQSLYTTIIIYGTVDRETLRQSNPQLMPRLFITNSTLKNKKFQSKTFDIMNFQNQQSMFKQKLQKLQNQADRLFVKHVIYNLMGGLAYYEGKLFTQNSIMSHQHDYSFTFTPSRLIFPRSFLWDDGFHNTIMATYKPELTMQILHNWFKKIDIFGWIGREQIRGMEIGSMMPDSRFIFQDVFQLNPPTIVMPILKLIQNKDQLTSQTQQQLTVLLENHFSSLEKHFRYFVKTQSHYDLAYKEDITKTIKYRWRCKDQCAMGNFMGSGLDDYPRVQAKTQISKQHIDLSSWLWFFSDSLEKIAEYLDKQKQALFYSKWKQSLKSKMMQQCLDQTEMLFKDLAVKGSRLFVDQKVTKLGYINLFPFFVGLLQSQQNQSPQHTAKILSVLNHTLDIMLDQNILMSEGGIRSLSLNDTDYASQQNYWRGAVWMPINYMILRACKKYYWDIESDVHRQKVRNLYTQLRKRLITTVQENYKQSGYLFENYIQGKGNRGFPFYGWTALIASIMLEDY